MNTNQIARIAGLVGEPARTAMLLALMDGRALTARELAQAGRITPATASRHLALLVEAGLLRVEPQGRHRYHCLASADVAQLLESLLRLAVRGEARPAPPTGPKDDALRRARRCYDHLAGRLGVAITEHLLAADAIVFDADAARPRPRLAAALDGLGLDTARLDAPGRRVSCRPCLDWSERRPHVAGRLGALLLGHCLEQGWLQPQPASRVLQITPGGAAALRGWLGLQAWQRVVGG